MKCCIGNQITESPCANSIFKRRRAYGVCSFLEVKFIRLGGRWDERGKGMERESINLEITPQMRNSF